MAENGQDREHRGDRRGRALAVYLSSATLVRSANGGAAVGLVSLTVGRGSAAGGGAVLGGLLAALLTAPNAAGPWVARRLEAARDSRLLLGGAFCWYGIALGGAAALLGHAPTAVVAVLITLGGLCDPLMTGGLSSRLALIVGGDARTQRRAEGWDAATYGMSGIAGPAAVAGLTVLSGPLAALLVLAAAAVLGGLLLMLLPANPAAPAAGEPMRVRDALQVVAGVGPLRRVMAATMLTSVGAGGVMVVAVVLGSQLRHATGSGAVLGAAYGVGGLVGALATGAFPPSGEPERRTVRLLAVNAVAVALCAAVPGYAVALVAFAAAGASSTVLFTATLAVRSVYSPPNARAQVFVIMAGFKMATAAGGTALAGVLVDVGPRLVLVLGALLSALSVAAVAADRRFVPGTLLGAPARSARPAESGAR